MNIMEVRGQGRFWLCILECKTCTSCWPLSCPLGLWWASNRENKGDCATGFPGPPAWEQTISQPTKGPVCSGPLRPSELRALVEAAQPHLHSHRDLPSFPPSQKPSSEQSEQRRTEPMPGTEQRKGPPRFQVHSPPAAVVYFRPPPEVTAVNHGSAPTHPPGWETQSAQELGQHERPALGP